jgi:hypothetical protein
VSSPPAFTRATVDIETPAIDAWCGRKGWTWRIELDELQLRAARYHPSTGRLVEVRAALEGYPALPPTWLFVVPGTDESPKHSWPAPGAQPGVSGSVFHTNPCLCAPWNRLAYGDHGGPHGEWTMTSWRQAAGDYTKADTLADMLDQIHQHLAASPGMQE